MAEQQTLLVNVGRCQPRVEDLEVLQVLLLMQCHGEAVDDVKDGQHVGGVGQHGRVEVDAGVALRPDVTDSVEDQRRIQHRFSSREEDGVVSVVVLYLW